MKRIILMLLSLCVLSCISERREEFQVFDHLDKGYQQMAFLSNYDSKILSNEDWISISNILASDHNMAESQAKQIEIANSKINSKLNSRYFINEKATESVFIEDYSFKKGLLERWEEIRASIGVYSGINGNKEFFYIKREAPYNNSLNATFRTNNYIINLKSLLSFSTTEYKDWSDKEIEEFIQVLNGMNERIQLLDKYFINSKDQIYRPLANRVLTPEERLFGFIKFWSEVEYNFAFFDQVPDLDWQQVLLEYIPKVSANQSNLEYYKTLAEVCALLNDGHTNIYFPFELSNHLVKPPLEFVELENHIYLVNYDVNTDARLQLGQELIMIDNVPVSEYLNKNISPYIASSTPHIKRKQIINQMLEGPEGTTVRLKLKNAEGEETTVDILRSEVSEIQLARKKDDWKAMNFVKKNDIGVIEINTFGSEKIVNSFEQHLDSIRGLKSLIIDLRNNGGGNSWYGYEILKHFTQKPIITSKWKTREHKPAFKAWGSFIEGNLEELEGWNLDARKTYLGDFWYESPPDTILSEYESFINIPITILIGNNTASAAEDFLVAAQSVSLGKTIGDFTYGSTGQPLMFPLPGGGSARICTKRDVFPDDREFVGYGIKPDYVVRETLEDILNDHDPVLEYAINFLSTVEKIN